MGGQQVEVSDGCDRLPLAVEVVLDAKHDERASKALLALLQIRTRQPMSADNSMIERLCGAMIIDRAAECEAHGGHAAVRAAPQIHADQGLRLKPPGRLFADFAND